MKAPPSLMELPVIAPSHPLARGRNIVLALIACAISLTVFRLLPEVDLYVASRFFSPQPCPEGAAPGEICGRFLLAHDPFWRAVRAVAMEIPHLLVIGTIIWGLCNLYFTYRPSLRIWQGPLVGLIALAVGPILLVNYVLKVFDGRARPFQLQMFGAQQPFSLPGDFASNCTWNCSFPSGEVTIAMWMVFLAAFIKGVWRWVWVVFVLAFTVATAFGRIAFGRHFLSDTVMAALLALLFLSISFWLVARWPDWFHKWRGSADG